MTSASRPTWSAAMGSAKAPSMQYSSRDLTSHAKLKLRAMGQGAPGEGQQRQDLRAKLVALENKAASLKTPPEESIEAEDQDADIVFERPLGGKTDFDDRQSVGSDSGEDEDDDVEALLKELEKIKKEREVERQRKQQEEEQATIQKSLAANPLLGGERTNFMVKRRWDDDVVFKSQASALVNKPKKRFINDTLRSDFHRKFLDRYIK